MPNYISSNANRFYLAAENAYGSPAPIGPANRFQAIRLQCHQSVPVSKRRDKTGARTHLGGANTAKRFSHFDLSTCLTSWDLATAPPYGPLLQAAMGEVAGLVNGLVVAGVNGNQIRTQAPHNLNSGSAIASGGEIRFVTSIGDLSTVSVNVPFSVGPAAGSTLATTFGYRPAAQLPSVSIYDYWDPANAVSRLVTGASVDKFRITIKGDTHDMHFSGPACDVLDSCSAAFGVSGIGTFPPEPALSSFDYSIVPGQLGQVWLGSPLAQVFTLTGAEVEIKNNLLVRDREFGSSYSRAAVPGIREVKTTFTLFAQDDAATRNLYAAAKTRMPISAMLQLGQQAGQIMAVYLPAVLPEMALFEDSQPSLLWEFTNNVAQGVSNDEAFVAFA